MLARFDGGCSIVVWVILIGDEIWVYSFNLENNQQSVQWTAVGVEPHQKFRRERSVAELMVTVFVAKRGHVATVPLKWQRTVTGDLFTTYPLPQVLEAIARRNPMAGAREKLLHYENTPAHKLHVVLELLDRERIQEVGRPYYGPNLVTGDFCVCPSVKRITH
ncbi:unnamed protein product [Dicrocoelium dendriticum]|nr:unnamed protein product [Dicrocoelium dendriticum]